MIALLALSFAAFAQQEPVVPIPAVRGDALEIAPLATRALTIDESDRHRVATARLLFGYAHQPLVAREEDGVAFAYVRHAVQAVIAGGGGIGPVRLGFAMPVWIVDGDLRDAVQTTAGDPAFDLTVVPLSRQPGKPGIVIAGRVSFPLGAAAHGVGHGGIAYTVGLALDGEVGPAWIGGQIGWRGVPDAELVGGGLWDDQVVLRAGTAVDVHPMAYVTGEIFGGISALQEATDVSAAFEFAVGAGWKGPDGIRVHGHVGGPMSVGLGIPNVRVVAGMSWSLERPIVRQAFTEPAWPQPQAAE